MAGGVELRIPSPAELPGYVAALERGWSADTVRGRAAAEDELAEIARDSAAFLASLDDREAKGQRVKLADGSTVERLPGYRRWIWDGEMCGSIGIRWQVGTSELPPYVPGHVGYSIVPWKRRLGYATRALALLLPEARQVGLDHVELSTSRDNLPSQRVIAANGGKLVRLIQKDEAAGGGEALLFRIDL